MLDNNIKSFISLKNKGKQGDLNSHPPSCMCIDHLIYYKKIKSTVIEEFITKYRHEHANVNKESKDYNPATVKLKKINRDNNTNRRVTSLTSINIQ